MIEAQAHYQRLREERGWNWSGEHIPDWWRWVRFFVSTPPPFKAPEGLDDDLAGAVRSLLADQVPPGVVAVRIAPDGTLAARPGPARAAITGDTIPIDVIFDSAAEADLTLELDRVEGVAERYGTRWSGRASNLDIDGGHSEMTLRQNEHCLTVAGMVNLYDATALHLVAEACSRWSVTDSSGGAGPGRSVAQMGWATPPVLPCG